MPITADQYETHFQNLAPAALCISLLGPLIVLTPSFPATGLSPGYLKGNKLMLLICIHNVLEHVCLVSESRRLSSTLHVTDITEYIKDNYYSARTCIFHTITMDVGSPTAASWLHSIPHLKCRSIDTISSFSFHS